MNGRNAFDKYGSRYIPSSHSLKHLPLVKCRFSFSGRQEAFTEAARRHEEADRISKA
ncbi:hypothetical protein CBM2588_A80084 [Cupriavidus taiwanensis]|nr:hypothetical protein CBM2588_A80084 [Cupriavidus taiwanensis]SOY80119.1 hypothetical protein CBM2591_A130002 [Cupriavidus taiwanensis]SOZ50912.1 hypothetical protein CBM2617_A110078 [Cupriavidus taiwanensis]SOZ82049.1 hypothetical protein CBM2621_A120078 [Cupriavidus taiwanensis]SPD42959.1 protein of unknown function [Cupriavidus taiwanensis]